MKLFFLLRTDVFGKGMNSSLTSLIFVSDSHQTELDTRSMTQRSIIVGGLERGRSGTSQDSTPAGLCWSSTHLVQCGPDEPSWTWTQARMPDYSLNWTARSSGINRTDWVL